MGVYPNMMQPIPYFKYNNRTGKKFQKEQQPQGNDDESQLQEHQQHVQSQEHDNVNQQDQSKHEE